MPAPFLKLLVKGNALIRLSLEGLLLAVLITACSQAPVEDSQDSATQPIQKVTPWFAAAAKESNLDFTHASGHREEFLFPEIMCGGVACLDYDQDGWFDLYFVQGGNLKDSSSPPLTNQLYRNLGNGRFENVSTTSLTNHDGYGMGAVCADFDNDGLTDIYVTNVGKNVLYRNLGNGTFEDVSQHAGVDHDAWGASASFLDYDRDGDLDLFVVNYIRWSLDTETTCYSRGGKPDYCSPLSYKAPAKDVLFQNNGDGTFRNVTAEAGVDQAFGNGLGVACADFDGDTWVDIFVANDATPNQLWINQKDGTFKNEALIRGCAVNGMGLNEAGMGVGLSDLNQDGSWDLFVTHLESESNTLYLNTNGYFRDEVKKGGPGVMSWPFTGFGIVFGDFNNDAQLDTFVANGRVKYGPKTHNPYDRFAEPNHLLKGSGEGRFEDITPAITIPPRPARTSRASIQVDLNNDGSLDLVTVNRDHTADVLINQDPEPSHHWIRFRLLNIYGSDPIGTTLEAKTESGVFRRLLQPGLGYCSSQDPRLHFGLGPASEVSEVKITWPDGRTSHHGPFSADTEHEIIQPD